MMTTLYDNTGAAFSLDHEHGGTAYVRPMVKVVIQATNYRGDDFHEEEDYEPASYLVTMDRADLFDEPPIEAVNQDVAAKRAELEALKSEAKKVTREINSERTAAERELQAAKRQLDEWMKTHRVMIDLGKLLDGQVLYPLSTKENPYHYGRDIPFIPETMHLDLLVLTSGKLGEDQPWQIKHYSHDHYGSPFRFFETEEERDAVIREEFAATCQKFRQKPNFDTTSHTTSTTLHYGTLIRWVKTHPALSIPDDIEGMKAEHDAMLVEQRKAKLAAELAEIESAT